MKLFSRFTGKELEENIEEYTELYGEILIGMHKKLNTLEKQLGNINEQHSQMTNLPDLYKELMSTTTYEVLESLKEEVDLLRQLMESIKETTSNRLTQNENMSDQLRQEFQNEQEKLTNEIERIDLLINQNENKMVIFQKKFTVEQERYIKKLNEFEKNLQTQVTDLNNLLANEINKNTMIVNSLIKEQSEQQNEIDKNKSEIIKNKNEIINTNSELEKSQQQFKQVTWGVSIGFGLILIWEIIQQLM